MRIQSKQNQVITNKANKPHLRAKGSSLLPLALRPGLLDGSSVLAIIFTLLIGLTICSNLGCNNVSAASLTLSIPSTAVSLNITPSSSGAFAKSSASTIGVKSDASFGYTLSIKGKSSDNSLVNGSNKIASISAAVSETDFSSSGAANTWGYLPSKLNGAANSNYQPAPSTTGTVIEKTTGPNASTANNYTVSLAAKVNGTVPAGNYANTFTFSATANSAAYKITYDLQSGSWTDSSPQQGSTTANSITLSSITPTRTNYKFLGWCNTTPTNNATASPSCSGNTYQPSATYPLTASGNTVTLYAMWKVLGPVNLGDLGTMQNFSCSKIGNAEDYGTVTDNRDNNTYKVAKLKDNKCWMIENLKLIGYRTLTSANSDVNRNFTLPASIKSFSTSDYSMIQINDSYASRYGVYYSWGAATAGTGTDSTESGNASSSICPKGWRLPTQAEFSTLVTAYGGTDSAGSTALRAAPAPSFVLSGYYNGSSDRDQENLGYYWSSTAYSSAYAYYLYLDSSAVNPSGRHLRKYIGQSVRCVARN